MSLQNVRVVLVRPQGAANVGAVARAMKNMGLGELAVVQPRVTSGFWSNAMAVHARDLLAGMQRFRSLAEAVADCGLVIGTTCRSGLYRASAEPPRALMPSIAAAAETNRVALVFGPEDHGLSNEDLKACHQLICIPTAEEYSSLNLAQAVMVCAYELFLAVQANEADAPAVPELATAERLDFLFQRLQSGFLKIGYLQETNPDHIMFAYRRFLGRARLSERDVRILLALARQVEWYGEGGWRVMAAKRGEILPATGAIGSETQAPPSTPGQGNSRRAS